MAAESAGACVLVVDDHPEAAQALCEMVAAAGFECETAGSDRAAYQVIAGPGAVLALVVDVNLGAGTTGYDVARYARRLNSALPVIYVSGESTQSSFREFGVPKSQFLQKPFGLADLEEALRIAME